MVVRTKSRSDPDFCLYLLFSIILDFAKRRSIMLRRFALLYQLVGSLGVRLRGSLRRLLREFWKNQEIVL